MFASKANPRGCACWFSLCSTRSGFVKPLNPAPDFVAALLRSRYTKATSRTLVVRKRRKGRKGGGGNRRWVASPRPPDSVRVAVCPTIYGGCVFCEHLSQHYITASPSWAAGNWTKENSQPQRVARSTLQGPVVLLLCCCHWCACVCVELLLPLAPYWAGLLPAYL